MKSTLPPLHLLLALAVMVVWGTNFVVIRFAVEHLPPLLLATLRFTFAALPAIFFVKRPKVPWRHLAAYGVFIGAGQFGALFIAMKGQISPGLVSLVVQSQVFFTIGLSMALTREKVRGFQLAALVLAVVGLGVILVHSGTDATPLGLGLTLLAALCWAIGNTIARASGPVNMLAYVVWSSPFAIPPLIVLSLVFEGWPAIAHGLVSADAATWTAVLWQSVGNTLFGYAAWGWLLSRHPTASVTPLALLVPVVGMATAAVVIGEPLQTWKLAAAALVMSGLGLNTLWPAFQQRFTSVRTALDTPRT
jgi:O-acetylserine/cysteine efflux transporter